MRELASKLSDKQLRTVSAALGLSLCAFGALPAVAPGPFGRLFGFDRPTAEVASMMRSIGARDVATGLALWSAATHGGNFAPWLLARIISDGGDVVAIGVAAAQGARDKRFLTLGALAFSATLADTALWMLARRSKE
ncbi:MAG TPA: DUF4267 domain-containing protein [Ktedonobacterales bacterium]|nr:DUF4267 domain-containing protein [Ktedonobacterales bacterium]